MENDDFLRTFKESCSVFAKYQINIHHDRPGECDRNQVRFKYSIRALQLHLHYSAAFTLFQCTHLYLKCLEVKPLCSWQSVVD